MRERIRISVSFLLLTVYLLTFSAQKVLADEVSISQEEKEIVNSLDETENTVTDEMTVYFIRDSVSYGSLRRIWATCNENAIASISSGGHCVFTVKTGPNIINVVQERTPAGFYLLTYRPGEKIYLLYDYVKGIITPVEEYIGEVLVKGTKYEPLLENTRPSDAYEYSIFNPGVFKIENMKIAKETLSPDSENAVITFIRPDTLAGSIPFGIWSEDGYLGTLIKQTYFQVKVKPGKHFFMAKSTRFSVLEAEVEAGKNYYIKLDVKGGWTMANAKLLPIKLETDETLQAWLKKSVLITYDQNNEASAELELIIDKAKVVIEEVLDKVASGEIETGKLLLDDVR
jgi:hypothetical protein